MPEISVCCFVDSYGPLHLTLLKILRRQKKHFHKLPEYVKDSLTLSSAIRTFTKHFEGQSLSNNLYILNIFIAIHLTSGQQMLTNSFICCSDINECNIFVIILINVYALALAKNWSSFLIFAPTLSHDC